MEGARSQKSPTIHANSKPSVSKVKVIKSDSLRILYYNARSLLPKLDELSATIEAHDFPDIVCIVESWLCHDIREQEIAIPNYNVFRHDRNRHDYVLLFLYIFGVTQHCPGLSFYFAWGF